MWQACGKCECGLRNRAEATDVANAVIDGADAFLLGASTLRGRNPVLTVGTRRTLHFALGAVYVVAIV